MKNFLFFGSFLLFYMGIISFGRAELQYSPVSRPYYCYRVADKPVVDGDLQDNIWQGVPWTTGFSPVSWRETYVTNQTSFAACYDNSNIYFAIKCDEVFPERIKAKTLQKDGDVFQDECIEIFIVTDMEKQRYVQLAVNAANSIFDGLRTDSSWNGEWKSAVMKTADGWQVEISLPFGTLGIKEPKTGSSTRVNVGRDRWIQGLEINTWNPIPVPVFHNQNFFGTFHFVDSTVRLALDDEKEINRRYFNETKEALKYRVSSAERNLTAVENISPSIKERLEMYAIVGRLTKNVSLLKSNLTRSDVSHINILRLTPYEGMMQDIRRLQYAISIARHIISPGYPTELKLGVNLKGNIYYLVTEEWVYAVDGKSGIISGIWKKGVKTPVVTESADLYTLYAPETILLAEERTDGTLKVNMDKEGLRLICENPNFKDIQFTKEYRLEGKRLIKRVTVDGRHTGKRLLTGVSQVFFEEDYLKGSYYHRGGLPMSGAKAIYPEEDIITNIPQYAGFVSNDGTSILSNVNRKLGIGLGAYLLTINGEVPWTPRMTEMTYLTPFGWDMSYIATFIKEKPVTFELSYHPFEGDRLTFHLEYLKVPEVKIKMAECKFNPKAMKVRLYGGGPNNIHQYAGDPNRVPPLASVNSRLMRQDELSIEHAGFHDWWGSYPSGDDATFIRASAQGELKEPDLISVKDVRLGRANLKEHFPQFIFLFYNWLWEVYPKTSAYREDWVIWLRSGVPLPGVYGISQTGMKEKVVGLSPNWGPEYTDYVIEGLCKSQLDYLDLDAIYFDNFEQGESRPDWRGERVIYVTEYMKFIRKLQTECHKRGKMLFLNSRLGELDCDLALWDGGVTMGVAPWIEHDNLLMHKIYVPRGCNLIMPFWNYKPGDTAYHNYRPYFNAYLSYGFRAGKLANVEHIFDAPGTEEAFTSVWGRYAPLYGCTLEMVETEFADIDMSPAWWTNLKVDVEAVPLKQGASYIFTANNHSGKRKDFFISADAQKMGFKQGDRIFTWVFRTKDPEGPQLLPVKVEPLKEGWDRLFEKTDLTTGYLKGTKVNVQFRQLPPELTYLAVVSQVPGFIYSAGGERTQLLLPETLGCKIEGELNEKLRAVSLTVNADKPLQIIAYAPASWGEINVSGKNREMTLKFDENRYVFYGRERFLLIDLPSGISSLSITGKQ